MTHAVFIDDDSTSLMIFDNLCQEIGIRSTILDNSKNIIDIVNSITDVDVVFIDLEMAPLNGYDILAGIRVTHQDIPIIACSVYYDEVERAQAQGFNGFIRKPIDLDKFGDQIQQIIAGEHIWQTGGE